MKSVGVDPVSHPGAQSPRTELQRWNERFATEDYLFGTEPNAFLAAQGHLLKPGQKALAIADGEGRNGVWLTEQRLAVLSIDFSPVALTKARQLASARAVDLKTELADMETWEWAPDQFNVVAAIFIQFANPQLREVIFRGIRRTLVPGGVLILQGYRQEQLQYGTGGPSSVQNMYTAHLLRNAFSDFDILRLEEHDSAIREGQGHGGMSALIDFIARKPV